MVKFSSLFAFSLCEAQQIYEEFLVERGTDPLLPADAICQEPFDIINTRIVNGRQTQGNWPFIVRLELYPTRQRTEFYQCGGSVINNKWVLTAAHCLDDIESADVVIGSWLEDEVVFNQTKIESSTFFSHPNYNTYDRRQNDIALIYIEDGIPKNDYVKPICLNDRKPERRERCFVAGWGTTDSQEKSYSATLMEAMVPMMDVRACGRPDSYGKSFDDKIMICAGYWVGQTDTCVGDSGGPLVCIDGDLQPHVAGIISWGKGCAKAQYPGIYTRVGSYVDWIRSVIRGDVEPSRRPENKRPRVEAQTANQAQPKNSTDSNIDDAIVDLKQPNGNSTTVIGQGAAGGILAGRMDTEQLSTYLETTGNVLQAATSDGLIFGAEASPNDIEETVAEDELEQEIIELELGTNQTDDTEGFTGKDAPAERGEFDELDKYAPADKYYTSKGSEFARNVNADTPCGNLFDKYKVNLNVEVRCDAPGSRRCRFTCEDPNFRPTLRNAFCKNVRRKRWSPQIREEVECVRKHTVTLCGSVYRFFDIDLLAAPRCAGNKCRFECPIGTQPSHPQGIRCRAPRVQEWDVEPGTSIKCMKVEQNFNDFTNKCGLLRLHKKTSWLKMIPFLQVNCQKQRMQKQVCDFSCAKGKRLIGTDSVTCYRDEEGIFLTDIEQRPVCK